MNARTILSTLGLFVLALVLTYLVLYAGLLAIADMPAMMDP